MKKILLRYDWGEQPATANCSCILVVNPLGEDNPARYAVYTWNRDTNGMANGHYFQEREFTAALSTLVEKVQEYERRYGTEWPGAWVGLG